VKPRLLDLFCGAGGAAAGYARAGFEVVGVDINPQPDYPFPFIRADAIDFLHHMEAGGTYDWFGPTLFAAVHASPPCQASSALTKGTNKGRVYEQLIPVTRDLLARWQRRPWGDGLATIIENVQGSELRRDLTLCGEMFGLDVIRHRYFEVDGFTATAPAHKPHRGRVRGWRHGTYYDGPYVAVYGDGGGKGSVPEWQAAMEITWTDDRKAIAEAIPPAYTEHIGRQLIAQIQEDAA
jgi:DNA (cytosine-5)-methyltransferase 1